MYCLMDGIDMIKQFYTNIIELGFGNIMLYGFVLLVIHQAINSFLIVNIEKYYNIPVQFYWHDIPITIIFICLFIYGIYIWK